MKYSRQRDLILKALKDNVVHPSADYLYGILKKQLPQLSLATVYRNLNLLAENGLIKRIEGLDGSIHFDHNTYRHYHFICKKCKKIYDIPVEPARDMIAAIEEKAGLEITDHDMVFKGVCPNCKNVL